MTDMKDRLKQIVECFAAGKTSEFARMMDWSPQYLHRMVSGDSGIGLQPVVALLRKLPELNARWLLLGEGAMIQSNVNAAKASLLRLLTIEQYMPVMSPAELRQLADGKTDFDRDTFEKWMRLLAERNADLADKNIPPYYSDPSCNPPTVN